MLRINSIKFKISVLYIIFLGVIIFFYSSYLYLSLRHTLYDDLDEELKKKAQAVGSTIDSYSSVLGYTETNLVLSAKRLIVMEQSYEGSDDPALDDIDRRWLQKADKFDLREDQISITQAGGRPLMAQDTDYSRIFTLYPSELKKISEGEPVIKSSRIGKRDLRIISTPFSYDNQPYIIQVATSLKPVIHLLRLRLFHILFSMPVILLIASISGQLFARRMLKPVREITDAAKHITHEDLSRRVRAEHIDLEMKYLVEAFNDMICRLEQSFKYIAEFSSQVAHELKTPLAIIKGESDLVLRKDRDVEEYKRVIRVNMEEAERMLKVTEDLLLLGKIDYRQDFFKFEPLNINEFLKEVYEQSRIFASEKNIAVNMNMPKEELYVNADKLHLRRLFFNLISNAVKFTLSGGKLDIKLMREGRFAYILFSDTGIGIKPEDLPLVFNKFFHIDRTGQNTDSGSGLGLSIAQSIAKAHNAVIKVESVLSKGSVFTVKIPLCP